MNNWMPFIVAGLVTYLLRGSFIILQDRIHLPVWFQHGLRYVPAAVISALIWPELLIRDGVLDFSFGNTQLIAGLFATLVAWRTRSVLITIIAGLAVWYVLEIIL
jgi:branched-subunit amino acid transport protein